MWVKLLSLVTYRVEVSQATRQKLLTIDYAMCKMQHPNHVLMVIKVQERLISDILRHNRRTKIELAHEQMGHFRKISAELPKTQFLERWEDYIGCSIHAVFFFIFKLFFTGRFPIAKNEIILHSMQSSGILLCRPLIRHFIPSSGIVVFSAALGATAKGHAGPGSFIDRASSCECSKFKDHPTTELWEEKQHMAEATGGACHTHHLTKAHSCSFHHRNREKHKKRIWEHIFSKML